jgi:indoleamine 2,3-dioxygenase
MLPLQHFLSLARPQTNFERPQGVTDTTTLAAHDFDVDNRTGFMPPQPPIDRLPAQWEPWEVLLEQAIHDKLQLGETPDLSAFEIAKSSQWRARVSEVRIYHHVISVSLLMIFPSFPSFQQKISKLLSLCCEGHTVC